MTAVWMLLVAATLLTWWLGTDHPFASANIRLASALAIVIAIVKVFLIGLDFMELRDAPKALRRAFTAWAVILGTSLTLLYVL